MIEQRVRFLNSVKCRYQVFTLGIFAELFHVFYFGEHFIHFGQSLRQAEQIWPFVVCPELLDCFFKLSKSSFLADGYTQVFRG